MNVQGFAIDMRRGEEGRKPHFPRKPDCGESDLRIEIGRKRIGDEDDALLPLTRRQGLDLRKGRKRHAKAGGFFAREICGRRGRDVRPATRIIILPARVPTTRL